MANFYGTTSYDYFVGPNERNDYYFDGRELGWTATDVVFGGAAEDLMHFTGAQTFGPSGSNGLEWIASIEYLYFDDFNDDIEIPNGLVATSSISSTYRFVVGAGGGEDFINARYVTSNLPILLEGGDDDDVIWGGGGDGSKYTGGDGEDFIDLTTSIETAEGGDDDDTFYGDVTEINGDTIGGGFNYDTLTMATPGTFALTMTSVEYLYLDSSADNEVTIESPEYNGGDSTFGNVYGGSHDDIVTIESVDSSGTWQNFVVYGNDGNDILTGGNGDDRLEGGEGIDGLAGGDGDDTLTGGADGDLMAGGTGDDTYVGVESGDLVLESIGLNGGIDTIETDQFNYIMPALVEVFHYTGPTFLTSLTVTGNTVDNTIEGIYYSDTLRGEDGNDTLSGLGANDTLRGGNGDDYLDGGTGADDMKGGANNDSYVVDDAGDTVTELANQGSDAVAASISYTLGENLEALWLTGTANIGGTGNHLDNSILGNNGGNLLKSLGGVDTLYGLDGADTLKGGAGADGLHGSTGLDTALYSGSSAAVTINLALNTASGGDAAGDTWTSIENLAGSSFGDTLTGNDVANVLDGGVGTDTLAGGGGNDIFVVDNTGDAVIEAANAGVDLINSSITLTLGDNIENLTLTGTANIYGTGNTLANAITGNTANSFIDGKEGDDLLTGNGGSDQFLITTALNALTNVDQITDFDVADDYLRIDNAVFAALPVGYLAVAAFHTGASAADTSDRIIYDAASGNIYYDADGVGGAAQTQFATLAAGLALDNGNIFIF
ncbi:MAG: beta strand repeat-containing protein [Aestuariivirga sp.]